MKPATMIFLVFLLMATTGRAEAPPISEDTQVCLDCHGTEVKRTGTETKETDFGEMDLPVSPDTTLIRNSGCSMPIPHGLHRPWPGPTTGSLPTAAGLFPKTFERCSTGRVFTRQNKP
ncbi:MAG: hypothetical protein U5R49_19890 [Deltaproteobacteria bacterium]|nr:hypothetical protein [Deltaproteobacteria bacterium]